LADEGLQQNAPMIRLVFAYSWNYNFEMTEKKTCQECDDLRKASKEAYRYAFAYRPFLHTGYRPKSRWCKADRDAVYNAEKAYNLAEAKYRLHLGTHAPDSINPRDAVRDLSTVMRGGRLKP
jgi:hypothetical protein